VFAGIDVVGVVDVEVTVVVVWSVVEIVFEGILFAV
jgi:hypothetical protein